MARSKKGAHDGPVKSVTDLLDRIEQVADEHPRATLGDVMHTIGDRSFGPLLLFAGLVIMAPVIGDIPGVPVLMGLVVLLTASQLLLRRRHIWLPGWLLRRGASRGKIKKGVGWMRPVGRVLDRWSKPRWGAVVHGAGLFVIGIACIIIASATPLMEVVPFSANVAGIAITAYGLALIVSDGLIAVLAILFSAATLTLVVRQLL